MPLLQRTETPNLLCISIVCYETAEEVLLKTVASAIRAIQSLLVKESDAKTSVVLVNNNRLNRLALSAFSALETEFTSAKCKLTLIQGHGNVGYGQGHNLAFYAQPSRYHLFMNPDVEMESDCLILGLSYLRENIDTGIVSPYVTNFGGEKQFLCKRYPSVFDFYLRGFAPRAVQKKLNARLDNYEMRDVSELEPTRNIPIVSGCFMLCDSEVIGRISGFDPQYFLYFEDFDLSMRVNKISSIAYLPSMRIKHYGGNTAKKGLKHIVFFVRSGIRFFNTYGWRWFKTHDDGY